ncbi:MAG TPA: hypothetical protein VGS79_22520 [Puia sp.]|nr:hypothetical protein [Puia sp.]
MPSAPMSDLGITGNYIVRDVWHQKDIGIFDHASTALLRRHGVVLVTLRPSSQKGGLLTQPSFFSTVLHPPPKSTRLYSA